MNWADLLFSAIVEERAGIWLVCSAPTPIDSRAMSGPEASERLSRLFNSVPRGVNLGKFVSTGNIADQIYLELVPPLTASSGGMKPMPTADVENLAAAEQNARTHVQDSLRDSLITPGMEWLVTLPDPPSVSSIPVQTIAVLVGDDKVSTIRAQFGQMTIERGWLDVTLLARQDWYWAGHRKWELSSPDQRGTEYLPAICVSAILLWAAYLEAGPSRKVLQTPGWSVLGYEVVTMPPSPSNDDPSLSAAAPSPGHGDKANIEGICP